MSSTTPGASRTNFDRTCRTILLTIHGVLLATSITSTREVRAAAPADISVRYETPAIPALIGQQTTEMAKLVIESKHDSIDVRSLRCVLAGTDIAADVESISVVDEAHSTTFARDVVVTTAGELVIAGEATLPRGTHTWLIRCALKSTARVGHSLQFACHEITTDHGSIEVPANASPRSQRIGVALRQHQQDGVHTYRIPALTTTRDGTLLAVYDVRRRAARDLQEDIDIGLSRSTDGGQTWEPMRIIADMGEFGGKSQAENGCSDPGLIVDRQTGTIFCFAVWMHGKPGKHQWRDDGSEPGFEIGKTAQMLMVRSTDDGHTWSRPENLTRQLKPADWWLIAPSPQQGIQRSDGLLVMPGQGRDEEGKPFATIIISRDHGATWHTGTPAYSGGSECQAVLLRDDRIMLNMRNDHSKFRAVFVTDDYGATWTPHPTDRTTLIEPTCNASLLRVDTESSKGTPSFLAFSNPHSQTARTHITLQVSLDEGMTWPRSHHILLDEGRGNGYSSLTQIDADHLGIVYEGSTAQLVFEKIQIHELLNRK